MAQSVKWIDFRAIGLEGQAWQGQKFESHYDRIPIAAKKSIPDTVWRNSLSPTGMSISFVTDSPTIFIRRKFESDQMEERNFNNCSFSGFDLYAEHNGSLRWVCTTNHRFGNAEEYPLNLDPIEGRYTYRLYLPCRNRLLKAELGIEAGAFFEPVAPRPEKDAIVYYGSSIVHGAYSSHAGLCHPAWLGRKLNRPTYNFGFSGAARMELEIADLLGTLNPAVFVLDPMPNMGLDEIELRAKTFLKRLRKLRPETPFLLVEDAPKTNGWIFRQKWMDNKKRWNAMRKVWKELKGEGENNIAYLKGNSLFGSDGEASIDSIHPGDLGYLRMTEHLYPVLKKILVN